MIIDANTQDFVRGILGFATDTGDRLNKTMVKASMKMDAELKQGTPVKTGNLRRSWHLDIKGRFETENYNTAPYVRHVEHGTKNFEGRHFVQNVEDRAQEIYDKAWEQSK